jgi:hypothetical protein
VQVAFRTWGQVPELDPGVVAAGFEPVVAVPGGDGVKGDQEARPVSRDTEPPGAVSSPAAPAGSWP